MSNNEMLNRTISSVRLMRPISIRGAGSWSAIPTSGVNTVPQNTPVTAEEVRRRVVVAAKMYLEDDETFGRNETGTFEMKADRVIGSRQPQGVMTMIRSIGGELRVELEMTAIALTDGQISLHGDVKLYEGTSEQTNDLDGQTSFDLFVPINDFVSHSVRVANTDEGGDFSDITLAVSNFPA
ncbi:hypothetical protein [Leptolyngbya sp. FACHB-261]|uniref:hypothetical protein n=1 Tax=Leptolyngbya sp. FACHB-261 TaxID=2692806 RepID=UPI0016891C1B|nr:hypothetical protein [Leptolyngbya sp. FACHB-261]MBD2100073.1 hypothetical protein [Leptolyngbya sp. FACHB-261]